MLERDVSEVTEEHAVSITTVKIRQIIWEAYFLLSCCSLVLFFGPEDGGSTILRNIKLLPGCTVWNLRR
jgi:hypothetical protein